MTAATPEEALLELAEQRAIREILRRQARGAAARPTAEADGG